MPLRRKAAAAADAEKIKGKDVDITGRIDDTIMVFKEATDRYEHESKAAPAAHASTHETGGTDKVHFADLEHDETDATLHDAFTGTPHISQALKDKIHDRLHALSSTLDHSGEITDVQHGVRGSGLHADSHARQHALSSTLDHTGEITDTQHGSRGAGLHADSHPKLHQASHQTGAEDALTGNLDAIARTTIRKNSGANVGSRRRLNFIEGPNTTLTIADDAANEEVDVTIASGGVTKHTELTDKDPGGIIDHGDHTIPDRKLQSSVGLNDGYICKLPTATEGQVLRRGATAWEAGTAPGGVTKHTELTDKEVAGIIDHADNSVPPEKLTFGTWQKLKEIEVTENVSRIDFGTLDINTHKAYMIFLTMKNPTSDSRYYLFVNGDTTTSNYYNQFMEANGTNIAVNRENNPTIVYILGLSETGMVCFLWRDANGYPRGLALISRDHGSAMKHVVRSVTKTATVTNITSIYIDSSVANAIGAGSKALLFGVSK